MVLDEPANQDKVFYEQGITYLMDRDLYERVKPVKVDYVSNPMGSGFFISSNLSTGNACGSCSC